MVEEHPAGDQQPPGHREVGRQHRRSDVLEHADRRDRVEAALHVAVVLQADVDDVVEAGRGDPLAGQLDLSLRQGHPDDPGAVVAGGVDRKAPPSAADVEQPRAGPQPQLAADHLELAPLRGLEVLRRVEEVGAGVDEVGVEEQPEEVVADVVVEAHRGGVAGAGVRLAVQLGPRQRRRAVGRGDPQHPDAGAQEARHRGAGGLGELVRRVQRRDRVALDVEVAAHVGLPGGQVAQRHQRAERAGAGEHQPEVRVGVAEQRAVPQPDGQPSTQQLGVGAADQPPRLVVGDGQHGGVLQHRTDSVLQRVPQCAHR